MKRTVLLLVALLFAELTSAQAEGQNFCDGIESGSYFSLNIRKKKIIWGNTFYTESKKGDKIINGLKYVHFNQTWENGSKSELYLREVDGTIFQYDECCEEETIRFSENFELNHSWKTADGKVTYTIVDTNSRLDTPVCNYQNLMVIKADFPSQSFLFYYLKGYGYVGAKAEGNLISFSTPR